MTRPATSDSPSPLAGLVVPRHLVQQRVRPVRKGIPASPAERNRVLQFVRRYVAEFNPVPPLPVAQLREHADRVAGLLPCGPEFRDYVAVLINNEMWRETFAAVPYSRRLLLLPKCLRVEDKCPATFDAFGLLCKQCGLCSIQDLQGEAEKLGYAVLVAEGSAVVTSLIQAGKIDAIVGVSCLNVLERAFPHMEAAAIPGLAIPLLQDDCADTAVDLDWVWEYIHLTSADQTRRLDLGTLRDEIQTWFPPVALDGILGPATGETERIGREWLSRAGKRWRPFLTTAAFQALCPGPASLPPGLRKLAVAVECFHKASLIHDDIEDNDATRYGEKTLHAEHGVPVALNIGDLLIGEGYRLIGECGANSAARAQMLLVAAAGQRELCRGQGAELCWARHPQPLAPAQVLEIFRSKTAPAFEVALKLGILFATGSAPADDARGTARPLGSTVLDYADLAPVLRRYSEALGIAYQIRDDLEDFSGPADLSDLTAQRPSLLLALAWEKSTGTARETLAAWWRRRLPEGVSAGQLVDLCLDLKAVERARLLQETYKEEAIRSLSGLNDPNLKGLLRRVIGRIFNDAEFRGWCKDVQQTQHESVARNAAGGAPGA